MSTTMTKSATKSATKPTTKSASQSDGAASANTSADSSINQETLVKRLNEDLAGELGAMIQYISYAAKVTGPFRPEVSKFFLDEVPDEQMHAEFLANKIVALGGEPTVQPRAVPTPTDNKAMLEAVLDAERRAIADYSQRAEEAKAYGDVGLAVKLEDIIVDETHHAEETERMLRDWAL